MSTFIVISIIIAIALIFIWLGLSIKPRPFAMPKLPQSETVMVALPSSLPAPVERFYRTVYGDQIPVIKTVTIIGHGRMRPFGIWLPARFVMIHNAGKDYRHYFEATFFGLPFLKVNEGYIDGQSFFESPMGTYINDPNTNQGANLALWAEGAWFPAMWITAPRVHWAPVDDNTAVLYVPFESREESFIVRFNPHTSRIDLMETMRFKAPNDKNKILWITYEVPAKDQPSTSYATWMDVGRPWASFTLDDLKCNLDVSAYIRARGQ